MARELREAHACVSFALRKAARSTTRRYDAALRSRGLRSTQFNLLVVLDARGASSTSALAKAMDIERTTLTRNLAILAKKGWVRAKPGDDGRSRKVSITSRGQKAALKALPAWRRVQNALSKALGRDKIVKLIAGLDELTRS